MSEGDPNILHGPKVPLEIPNVSLGQFMYIRLSTESSNGILMREAESGRFVTSSEFLVLSIKVAEGLKDLGLQPGDSVAVLGKAGIDVYATSTGILFQGGTVFPLDHTLPSDVFQQLLQTVEPKLVFCDAEVADKVAEVLDQLGNPAPVVLFGADPEYVHEDETYRTFESFIKPEVDLDDFLPVALGNAEESLAFLVCSSGTTGTPKPVMLTNKCLLFQLAVWSFISSFNKFLLCPAITFSYFFWISGILLYTTSVSYNYETIIVQKLDAKHILDVIEKYKPVWGMFSPLLAKYLTYHPEFKSYNVSSLSLMVTGGCSLQKVLIDKIRESWGSQLSCRQAYGLTELAGSVTTCQMDDDTLSVGRLLPGFQMKVLGTDESTLGANEEGEIFLKSPSLMKGYLKNQEATDKVLLDGWFRTGDFGYYTDKGLIYITGRLKDFIRFNNKLISPTELEEVIMGVPGVLDVGVAGIKMDDTNYLPMAVVVRKPGSGVTEEEIIKAVNENLPEHKHLRGGVCFADVIPRTPSGKMKRLELLNLAKSLYMEE